MKWKDWKQWRCGFREQQGQAGQRRKGMINFARNM
jgi:hypothetical protein